VYFCLLAVILNILQLEHAKQPTRGVESTQKVYGSYHTTIFLAGKSTRTCLKLFEHFNDVNVVPSRKIHDVTQFCVHGTHEQLMTGP
jgi:hypothetical protein